MLLVQADHCADMLGGGGVVAGQQHDLQAQCFHLADGLGRSLLDDIRHTDNARRFASQREVQRGHAVAAHFLARLLQVRRQFAGLADKVGVAARDELTGHFALQALAGDRLKIRNSGVGKLVPVRFLQNSAGQRVLASQFETSGHAEQEFFGHVAGSHDLDDARLTGGDGAGLVQQHGVGVTGSLQAGGCLEQNAVFCTHTAADHDGNRRCQAQCAGAADDQHADAARQRVGKGLAQQQPDNESQRCNADNGRHKDAGDFIGRFGQRGFGGSGVPHQADDLGQGSILADTLGPAGQRAILIDGRGADGRTGKLVHRHALAGQGCFVHAGNTLGDGAVHRDGLARANEEQVADLHFTDRQRDLLAAAQHTGGLRSQLHQAFQCVGRLALAVGFQRFADGDQRKDHSGRFKIQIVAVLHDQVIIASLHTGHDHDNGERTIGQRCARAKCDQRIHAGGAVFNAFPAADKECAVDPADGQCQHKLGNSVQNGMPPAAMENRAQRQADHMTHRDIHQRHQKAQAGDQALFQLRGLGVLQFGVFAFGGGQAGTVTGGFHRIADALCHLVRVGIGGVVDLHRVGQQADCDTGDTRHRLDRFFHMAGTSRTAHTGDLIALHGSSIAPLLKQ